MATGERIAAFVLSLAGLGVLVDTGHHGGKMVFEHAAGVPERDAPDGAPGSCRGPRARSGRARGPPPRRRRSRCGRPGRLYRRHRPGSRSTGSYAPARHAAAQGLSDASGVVGGNGRRSSPRASRIPRVPSFDPLLGVPSAEVRLAPRSGHRATGRSPARRLDSRYPRRAPRRLSPDAVVRRRRPARRPGDHRSVRRVVRVRGWVDPGRYGHSELRVEVAYRVLRDPSVPGRELERLVPPDHPVRLKVQAALDSLAQRFAD